MSIINRSKISYTNLLNILHNRPCYYKPTYHRFQSFFFDNQRVSLIHQLPKHNYDNNYKIDNRIGLYSTRSLGYLTTVHRLQNARKFTRNFTVQASIQQGAPLPPGAPKSSWVRWVFGILASITLPLYSNKWLPFLREVETTVDTVEQIVDIVEVVAEKVDEIAEGFSGDLPDGGNLKKTVEFIEDVAEEIVKDAKFAEQIIDKVQEVEEKLENQVN